MVEANNWVRGQSCERVIQKSNVHVEKECELMALGPWFGGLKEKKMSLTLVAW